jgi:hypothetical protein
VFTPAPKPEPASATWPTKGVASAMAIAVATGLTLNKLRWTFFTMSDSQKYLNRLSDYKSCLMKGG